MSKVLLNSNTGHQLTGLAADDRVRGVVLTGRGNAFCAGGDLKWALNHSRGPGAAFHLLAPQFHLAVLEIRRMKKPVVAAVNGVAAGGGFSLALACDFRVMDESAVLNQAYTSAGLCIDGGGTFTDIQVLDLETGRLADFKAPTTPDDPSAGLIDGIRGAWISEQKVELAEDGTIKHFRVDMKLTFVLEE